MVANARVPITIIPCGVQIYETFALPDSIVIKSEIQIGRASCRERV